MKNRTLSYLVICLSVFSLTGMGRVNVDRTQDSLYSTIIGKTYRARVELVAYRFREDKKELLLGVFGHGSMPQKEQMKKRCRLNTKIRIFLGFFLQAQSLRLIE